MSAQDRGNSALPSCCRPAPERKGKGLLMGLLYGLMPHTFCILFIVFSIIGATAATSVVQRVLYVPYLFQIIVALSLGFATLSAMFYLRRNGQLSWVGARRRWRYLTVMYGTTLAINLLLFWVVFPAAANLDLTARAAAPAPSSVATSLAVAAPNSLAAQKSVTLQVDIPCPGHAPLIISELKKVPGVQKATYRSPNLFDVQFDPGATSVETILGQEVFRSFPAQVKS